MRRSAWVLGLLCWAGMAMAQVRDIEAQVVTKAELEGRVIKVEVATRFVTAIRMPEPVNSVVVGDPATFRAESPPSASTTRGHSAGKAPERIGRESVDRLLSVGLRRWIIVVR